MITARKKAIALMDEHGLFEAGWMFDFDRAVRRLGNCDLIRKRITVSKYFTGAANLDEFEQALLHEIAHALLPASAKHGVEWQVKAKEIGYRGTRLANNPYAAQRRVIERKKRAESQRAAGNEK